MTDETPGSPLPENVFTITATFAADGYVTRGTATDDRVYIDDPKEESE